MASHLLNWRTKPEVGRTTLWILERGENPKTGKPSRPTQDLLERRLLINLLLHFTGNPATLNHFLAQAGEWV